MKKEAQLEEVKDYIFKQKNKYAPVRDKLTKPNVIHAINSACLDHGLTVYQIFKVLKKHIMSSNPIISLKAVDIWFNVTGNRAPARIESSNINSVMITVDYSKQIQMICRKSLVNALKESEPENMESYDTNETGDVKESKESYDSLGTERESKESTMESYDTDEQNYTTGADDIIGYEGEIKIENRKVEENGTERESYDSEEKGSENGKGEAEKNS